MISVVVCVAGHLLRLLPYQLSREIIYSFMNKNIDGGILTFSSTHPKWSYAKVNEEGYVTEVAEKKPISDHATVGLYFWKSGKLHSKNLMRTNVQ